VKTHEINTPPTQWNSPAIQVKLLAQTVASTFSGARSKSSLQEMSNDAVYRSGLPQRAAPIVLHSSAAEAIACEPTAESKHGGRMAPANAGVLDSPTEHDDHLLLEPLYGEFEPTVHQSQSLPDRPGRSESEEKPQANQKSLSAWNSGRAESDSS
jgi:hypothetical protein